MRRIGLEDPGSVALRRQVAATGLTTVAQPVDADGVRVERLVRKEPTRRASGS